MEPASIPGGPGDGSYAPTEHPSFIPSETPALAICSCSRAPALAAREEKIMPRSKTNTWSSPGSSGWVSRVAVLNAVGSLFIWEFAAASSASRKAPVIATLPPLSSVRGGVTESDGNARPNAVLIDADDIIGEMALASRQQPEKDSSEQVFKSTHVYSRPSPSATRRKRTRRWVEGSGETRET